MDLEQSFVDPLATRVTSRISFSLNLNILSRHHWFPTSYPVCTGAVNYLWSSFVLASRNYTELVGTVINDAINLIPSIKHHFLVSD
jgi:hypothetical protein